MGEETAPSPAPPAAVDKECSLARGAFTSVKDLQISDLPSGWQCQETLDALGHVSQRVVMIYIPRMSSERPASIFSESPHYGGTGFAYYVGPDIVRVRTNLHVVYNAEEASQAIVQFSLEVPGKRRTRVVRLQATPHHFHASASQDYSSFTCLVTKRLHKYLHVFQNVPVLWESSSTAEDVRSGVSSASSEGESVGLVSSGLGTGKRDVCEKTDLSRNSFVKQCSDGNGEMQSVTQCNGEIKPVTQCNGDIKPLTQCNDEMKPLTKFNDEMKLVKQCHDEMKRNIPDCDADQPGRRCYDRLQQTHGTSVTGREDDACLALSHALADDVDQPPCKVSEHHPDSVEGFHNEISEDNTNTNHEMSCKVSDHNSGSVDGFQNDLEQELSEKNLNTSPGMPCTSREFDANNLTNRATVSKHSGRSKLESGDFVAILSHPQGSHKCFSVGPAALYDPQTLAQQGNTFHLTRKGFGSDGQLQTSEVAVDLIDDRFRACTNRIYHTHSTYGCSGAPVLLFKRSLWPSKVPVVDFSQHSGTCFFHDGSQLGFATCFTPSVFYHQDKTYQDQCYSVFRQEGQRVSSESALSAESENSQSSAESTHSVSMDEVARRNGNSESEHPQLSSESTHIVRKDEVTRRNDRSESGHPQLCAESTHIVSMDAVTRRNDGTASGPSQLSSKSTHIVNTEVARRTDGTELGAVVRRERPRQCSTEQCDPSTSESHHPETPHSPQSQPYPGNAACDQRKGFSEGHPGGDKQAHENPEICDTVVDITNSSSDETNKGSSKMFMDEEETSLEYDTDYSSDPRTSFRNGQSGCEFADPEPRVQAADIWQAVCTLEGHTADKVVQSNLQLPLWSYSQRERHGDLVIRCMLMKYHMERKRQHQQGHCRTCLTSTHQKQDIHDKTTDGHCMKQHLPLPDHETSEKCPPKQATLETAKADQHELGTSGCQTASEEISSKEGCSEPVEVDSEHSSSDDQSSDISTCVADLATSDPISVNTEQKTSKIKLNEGAQASNSASCLTLAAKADENEKSKEVINRLAPSVATSSYQLFPDSTTTEPKSLTEDELFLGIALVNGFQSDLPILDSSQKGPLCVWTKAESDGTTNSNPAAAAARSKLRCSSEAQEMNLNTCIVSKCDTLSLKDQPKLPKETFQPVAAYIEKNDSHQNERTDDENMTHTGVSSTQLKIDCSHATSSEQTSSISSTSKMASLWTNPENNVHTVDSADTLTFSDLDAKKSTPITTMQEKRSLSTLFPWIKFSHAKDEPLTDLGCIPQTLDIDDASATVNSSQTITIERVQVPKAANVSHKSDGIPQPSDRNSKCVSDDSAPSDVLYRSDQRNQRSKLTTHKRINGQPCPSDPERNQKKLDGNGMMQLETGNPLFTRPPSKEEIPGIARAMSGVSMVRRDLDHQAAEIRQVLAANSPSPSDSTPRLSLPDNRSSYTLHQLKVLDNERKRACGEYSSADTACTSPVDNFCATAFGELVENCISNGEIALGLREMQERFLKMDGQNISDMSGSSKQVADLHTTQKHCSKVERHMWNRPDHWNPSTSQTSTSSSPYPPIQPPLQLSRIPMEKKQPRSRRPRDDTNSVPKLVPLASRAITRTPSGCVQWRCDSRAEEKRAVQATQHQPASAPDKWMHEQYHQIPVSAQGMRTHGEANTVPFGITEVLLGEIYQEAVSDDLFKIDNPCVQQHSSETYPANTWNTSAVGLATDRPGQGSAAGYAPRHTPSFHPPNSRHQGPSQETFDHHGFKTQARLANTVPSLHNCSATQKMDNEPSSDPRCRYPRAYQYGNDAKREHFNTRCFPFKPRYEGNNPYGDNSPTQEQLPQPRHVTLMQPGQSKPQVSCDSFTPKQSSHQRHVNTSLCSGLLPLPRQLYPANGSAYYQQESTRLDSSLGSSPAISSITDCSSFNSTRECLDFSVSDTEGLLERSQPPNSLTHARDLAHRVYTAPACASAWPKAGTDREHPTYISLKEERDWIATQRQLFNMNSVVSVVLEMGVVSPENRPVSTLQPGYVHVEGTQGEAARPSVSNNQQEATCVSDFDVCHFDHASIEMTDQFLRNTYSPAPEGRNVHYLTQTNLYCMNQNLNRQNANCDLMNDCFDVGHDASYTAMNAYFDSGHGASYNGTHGYVNYGYGTSYNGTNGCLDSGYGARYNGTNGCFDSGYGTNYNGTSGCFDSGYGTSYSGTNGCLDSGYGASYNGTSGCFDSGYGARYNRTGRGGFLMPEAISPHPIHDLWGYRPDVSGHYISHFSVKPAGVSHTPSSLSPGHVSHVCEGGCGNCNGDPTKEAERAQTCTVNPNQLNWACTNPLPTPPQTPFNQNALSVGSDQSSCQRTSIVNGNSLWSRGASTNNFLTPVPSTCTQNPLPPLSINRPCPHTLQQWSKGHACECLPRDTQPNHFSVPSVSEVHVPTNNRWLACTQSLQTASESSPKDTEGRTDQLGGTHPHNTNFERHQTATVATVDVLNMSFEATVQELNIVQVQNSEKQTEALSTKPATRHIPEHLSTGSNSKQRIYVKNERVKKTKKSRYAKKRQNQLANLPVKNEQLQQLLQNIENSTSDKEDTTSKSGDEGETSMQRGSAHDSPSETSDRDVCYVTVPVDIRIRMEKAAKWITTQVFGCPKVHYLTPRDARTFCLQQNLPLTMQVMELKD